MTKRSDDTDIIEQIRSLFGQRGGRSYGEQVTEQQHALQTATFALQSNEDDSMIVACLLHDFGHLLHDLGEDVADHGVDSHHEQLGADTLEPFFPPQIVQPIRLHAEAKRYLCRNNTEYLESLSAASRQSLVLQGGVMTQADADAFESNRYFAEAVRLRRYDDKAKVVGMRTNTLESFLPRVARFVTEQSAVEKSG